MNPIVTAHLVPDADRVQYTSKLFGINFPMNLEPAVFDMAGHLAVDYNGGYWLFYALSNGGFYMAPRSDTIFNVACDNGYEGRLTGDALGIVACLYAYSHLSFQENALAAICADQYHLLRDFMMEHREARAILRAID